MKKLLFFVSITFFTIYTFSSENLFSQTVKLIASNLNVSSEKEYVVDSIALFNFIENKEAEMKIEAYFRSKNMPLHEKAETFVKMAKRYNLPLFLLPAISVKESSGGKKVFRSFNAFGYGTKSFNSYEESIEYIANKLANGKYYKGKSLEKKIKTYNSVNSNYYSETLTYMKRFENQKIEPINYENYVDSFKVEKAKARDIKISNTGGAL